MTTSKSISCGILMKIIINLDKNDELLSFKKILTIFKQS